MQQLKSEQVGARSMIVQTELNLGSHVNLKIQPILVSGDLICLANDSPCSTNGDLVLKATVTHVAQPLYPKVIPIIYGWSL